MISGVPVPLGPPRVPSSPLTGWEVITRDNVKDIAPMCHVITSGMPETSSFSLVFDINMVPYLEHGVGCSETQRAFRALTRGYNHWASGRLVQLEVQTLHPLYCHIRATLTPSMKPGSYHVYVLLIREGMVGTIQTETCECAAGMAIQL